MTSTPLSRYRPLAVYPVLAIVVYAMSEVSYRGVPLWAGFRPLLIAIPIMIALQLVLGRLVGWQRGSFVAAMLGMFLAGAFVAGFALLAIAVVRTAMKLRWPQAVPSWTSVTRGLNVVGAAILAMTLFMAWNTETFVPAAPDSPRGAATPGAPNMYVFVLDAYPRTDTLADWGYDNEPFIAQLEDMGFAVSRESHSNYMKSWLSLATMADLRHVDSSETEGELPSDSVQHRRLSRLFNDGQGWDVLRQHGYEIVATEPAFPDLELYEADRTVGRWPINAFEAGLLRESPVSRIEGVSDWVSDAFRDRFAGQIEATSGISSAAPMFVWTHVLSPHAPAIFDREGSAVEHPCYPVGCTFFQQTAADMGLSASSLEQRLVGQVQYVNRLVADTVRQITTADPAAVVVVLADHGARHEEPNDEYFHTFFAARTPGHPHLFPPDVGMVTTLAVLLNAYLDAGVPVPSGEEQFMSGETLLELEAWPEP